MKSKPSKLDAFAERLDEWFGIEKKTLAEVQEQLKLDGCSISLSSLSQWWSARQTQKQTDQLFHLIASGGRMNKELDQAYASNPAPAIAQLINVTKTLVMSLQVKGAADPKLLNLANSMQQTVLLYLSAETKAALEQQKLGLQERRIELLEKKAAAYDRAAQALNEAKGGITPETLTKIERELKLL
jgi:hypothetical protein